MDIRADILRESIDITSIPQLCKSISLVGSHVADMPLIPTLEESQLRKYRYVYRRLSAYQEFEIPKKSGGTRKILAPTGELKKIMKALSYILNTIYVPTESAMGFVCKRSVKDNASRHLHANYVLNIDLSNFFPSISTSQVDRSLRKEGVDPMVASLIATICCYPTKTEFGYIQSLPQGAPTSPILSNICCRSLDKQLDGLAKRFHLTFTRYADDITFSSNHNVYQEDGEFWKELKRIIAEHHFALNDKKTRLMKCGAKQEVTGVTVGDKVNVSRKYIKNLRAMIHQLKSERVNKEKLNIIRGKLNYLRMIKGADDPTYKTLCIKFNLAIKGRVPKKRKMSK